MSTAGDAVHSPKAEGQPAKQMSRHPVDLKWETLEMPRPHPELTWHPERGMVDRRADSCADNWERVGGPKLEPLLDHVDLIDLRFVIENIEAGRPIPRWQDVPRGARINRRNLHRIKIRGYSELAVLVLSYPWLDKGHPDKQLITMRRLLRCFKAFLSRVESGETVGLVVDYCSLPQKDASGDDDRTEEEKQRFKEGLNTINEWYAHEHTTVLIYDVEMPDPSSGHTNLRSHAQRGWCSFELRASSMIKHSDCLWSLRGFERGGSPEKYLDAMRAATERVRRPEPMLPEQFGALLRDGVEAGTLAFTASADVEVVSEQYGKAFEAAFAGAKKLTYWSMGWGDDEVDALAAALRLAKQTSGLGQLEALILADNPCTEASLLPLAETLKGTGCTYFGIWETKYSEAGKKALENAFKDTNIVVRF